MRTRAVAEFTIGASLAAAAGGTALILWLAGTPSGIGIWGALGFALMAAPAITGGAMLAGVHGRPGSRFMVTFGAGLAARFAGAVAGMVLAPRGDGGARTAVLAGLAAAFVPILAFEMLWFARGGATRPRGAEAGR